MKRSLRRRLMVWFALILALTVGGLCAIFYQRVRDVEYARVDQQLDAAVRALESALRFYPPPILDFEELPTDGRRLPGPARRLPLELTGELSNPRRAELDKSYFCIWRYNETILKQQNKPPELERPDVEARVVALRTIARDDKPTLRQAEMRGPAGSTLVVGRTRTAEEQALHQLLMQLLLSGLGAFLLALLVTWWITGRIWRPLRHMSSVAENIAHTTDLSQRINTTGLDAELTPLALVLNEMFSRLEAAFERQSRFTADAAHELRTPLTILRLNIESALQRQRTSDEYRATLDQCLSATQRMQRLSEDLLTLTRADHHPADEPWEEVDLGELLQSAAARGGQSNAGPAISVNSSAATAINVSAQRHLLERLIDNLVENARRYTPAAGTITLGLERDEKDAIITVSDTGIGIAAEHLPRLFDRFYRVAADRARGSGGHGLGLAICRAIADRHRGTITVASEPEKGTTFTIRLPITTETNKISFLNN